MNTSCVTRPSISARTLSAPSCSGRHAARAPISLRPGCTAGLKSRGHRCAHSAVCPATKSSQQDNKGFLSSFLPNSDDDKLEKSSDENNGASSGLDNGAPSEQGSDGVPTFSKRLMSGDQIMASYLSGRVRQVSQHFPTALGVDDFIARMEIALHAHGFQGSNTIACCNLCRDEVTYILKDKLDAVFGSSFNTNGLGAVLTCGVTGFGAGLSHAPQPEGSKERYVFFSFPHIAIDATGGVGEISRPGRPGPSKACGALVGALGALKSKGLACSCGDPGAHDARDPEYSILQHRLARRLKYEWADESQLQEMDLVDMTKLAERTITDDLEYLISQSVDPEKADYAVVTGVQIHNWGQEFDDESPNLEFVAPASVYVVVNGERTYLDLQSIPPMTPRQISLLAAAETGAGRTAAPLDSSEVPVCGSAGNVTTVRSFDTPYEFSSRHPSQTLESQSKHFKNSMQQDQLQLRVASAWPSWQTNLRNGKPFKSERDNSVIVDQISLVQAGEKK